MRVSFNFNPEQFVHYKEVLVGASGSLLLRLGGAAVAFLFNLLVARHLGPSGVGIYGIAVTTVTIVASLAVCGMSQAAIKFIAAGASHSDWQNVRLIAQTALIVVLPASLFCAAALFLCRDLIARTIFDKSELGLVLALLCVAVTPLALRTLFASYLIGIKDVKSSVAIEMLLPASTALLLFYILPTKTLGSAAASFVAGATISVGAAFYLWHRKMAKRTSAHLPRFSAPVGQRLLRAGIPMLGVTLGFSFGQWIVLYLLGATSNAAEVGFYRVAFQISILLGFLLSACDTIMAPKISALFHQGRYHELARVCRFAILMITLPGAMAVSVLLLFPAQILSVFGPDFGGAAPALQILAVGQLLNLATGSVGTVLIMTGHERKSLLNSILGAFVALILSLVLIPTFAATGAAAALALTMTLRNLFAAYLVWRYVGVNVWTGKTNRFVPEL